jgi:hypothetical protein
MLASSGHKWRMLSIEMAAPSVLKVNAGVKA